MLLLSRTEHQKSPYFTPAASTGGSLRFGNVFSPKPVLTDDSYKPNVTPRGIELHNNNNDGYRFEKSNIAPLEGTRPALSSYLAREVHLKTPADEPLTWMVLKNGHQLLIVQKPGDLVGVRTFIDAGSIVENAVKPSALYKDIGFPSGIAHLDEHCHFLTTKNYPIKNQWSDEVEKAGANANASTDNEEIQHELFFNRSNLQKMLRLHVESVLNPTYNANDIHQEKSAVLNEVALRTKRPAFKLENKLDELFFDRPASQTGGKSEDVQNTTAEQLKRFAESTYHPERMVTVVAGNVNPQEVLSILGPPLSQNTNQGPASPNKGMLLALNGIKTATLYDPEWNNSRLLFGFPAPALKDYKDRMAMEFLREALNGSVNSPLRKNLVTESSIAQSTSLEYEPLKETGVLRLRVICSPGKEEKVLNTSLETLQSMATAPLSNEKMNLIRERLVSHFKTNSDTVDHTSYQMGSEAVSGTLPYYLNYEALANSIQTQDIMRIAQKYLDPERYALVYGLPPKPTDPISTLKFGQNTATPFRHVPLISIGNR
jgi:predicted Zn-dependent peptidase